MPFPRASLLTCPPSAATRFPRAPPIPSLPWSSRRAATRSIRFLLQPRRAALGLEPASLHATLALNPRFLATATLPVGLHHHGSSQAAAAFPPTTAPLPVPSLRQRRRRQPAFRISEVSRSRAPALSPARNMCSLSAPRIDR